MKRAIVALVILCACGTAFAGTLSTLAPTNVSTFNAGVYLDLTPTGADLSIYAIDTKVGTAPVGSPVTIYVYTCNAGSYLGNEATAANWTQVASVNAYSNGIAAADPYTRFSFKTPLVFPAGVTRGVLIWSPNGMRTTNTTTTTHTNADLTLFSNQARNALFGATATTPRVFSGNINYTLANQIEGAGEVEPYFVEQGCSTLLTVRVYPATSPASTGINVSADLSAIGGSSTQALFDDGTNGDKIAGDNIFSFLANVPDTVSTGIKSIPYTVSDQNTTFNSNFSVRLSVVADQVPRTISLPRGNQDTGGASAAGQTALIADQGQPRTVQMVFDADELKSIPVGAKIDSLSFRLLSNATTNPAPSWPPANLNYTNYDIRLSKLAAGLSVATMSTTSFTANIDAGSAVMVRSGPLMIPANSLGAGAAVPVVNPFNEMIIKFATPYVYDGTDLVITVSHNGFNSVGTRPLDSVVTTHAGFGRRFRCISANAYNATTGAAAAQLTVLRLGYHTDLAANVTVSPGTVEQNCNTLVTVQVTPGSNPASTGTTVLADLSALGGAPGTPLFDDGNNGDVNANDNIYSLLVTVPGAQPTGLFRVPVVVEDEQCRIDGDFALVRVVAPLSGIPSTTPSALPAGCPTLIKVAVTPAICSTSTGIAVVADLAPIGGAPNQTLFDNGTNGDQVSGDMIYSFQTTIPGSLSVGQYSGTVTITDLEGHIDQPAYTVDVVSPFANGVASTTPLQATVGSPVLIRLNLNMPSCAVSTNRTVTADLSLLGGSSSSPLLDNGVPPDATANDGIYTTLITAPPPACATYDIAITAQDNEGHVNNFNTPLLVSQSGDPVLFNSGPIVTHPGGGAGGFDLSALQNQISLPNIPIAMNILGFGGAAPNRAADDFVICDPAGWNISTITIYAYQTGSPITSTITSVTLRIWNGQPGAGGSVVFGDTTTNVMTSTCWTGIYRATLTDPLGTTRPVMACVLNVGTTLPPGRYWIDYSMSGSGASGPFTPPITRLGQPNTGNAMASGDGITYAAMIDTGGSTATYRAGLPFLVRGTTGSSFLLGDMNCSGTVNGLDIAPFAGVLTGSDTDPVRGFIADVNQDGVADPGDIPAMTSLVLN